MRFLPLAQVKSEDGQIYFDNQIFPEVAREPQIGDDRFPLDDEFEFSTGRRVYCHGRTFGISPTMNIGYGADGGVSDREWTKQERVELAKYMISLWTQYLTEAES